MAKKEILQTIIVIFIILILGISIGLFASAKQSPVSFDKCIMDVGQEICSENGFDVAGYDSSRQRINIVGSQLFCIIDKTKPLTAGNEVTLRLDERAIRCI
jgi:hypothetical protein